MTVSEKGETGGLVRRNERPPMQYRRFGRTNAALSVITLGGMRFHDGWSKPRTEPHREMIDQCARTVERALELGINHVETAYGYGKSEHCYGVVLDEVLRVPRDRYFLMTKGAPESGEDAHRMLEEQLRGLRTDHIDFYGWHGINTRQRLEIALAPGGPVETLSKYQEQGVIGHVGFSTHGPLDVICEAVLAGFFDFVNLHYYYFFQRNQAAVQLASARDMGVFIISPNDKGGQLFHAPPLLRSLTAPWTPIQFNARWCLRTPLVHTLSFGMNEPEHFEEMLGAFPVSVPPTLEDLTITARLDERRLVDRYSNYDGYELEGDPSGINISEVLRFRRLLRCYDMEVFGKYRYNMFEPGSHWFGGEFATEENLERVDYSRVPDGVPLRELLRETHEALYEPRPRKER